MSERIIVVGLGAMGSAAAYHLAKRGHSVIGLERYDIPHSWGSSHGVTRIIRLPYYEDPAYVPLLRRAFDLWRELERLSGRELLITTGSIDASPEHDPLFQGALASARLHSLDHEVLTGAEIAGRFPAYRIPATHRAVFQHDGGFLASERAIVAHVEAAQHHGAVVRAREPMLDWSVGSDGAVRIETNKRVYEADRLVLATGAWLAEHTQALTGIAVPERQVLAWLQPNRPEFFRPDRFPVFNLQVDEGRYYGLPIYDVPGFKFGRYHHFGETGPADVVMREPDALDEDLLRTFAKRYFPDGAGETMALRTCMFTNTPDEHFIVDHLPGTDQVIVASPCSGHGFKFASVIGEIIADLATGGGRTMYSIDFLRFGRPGLCQSK